MKLAIDIGSNTIKCLLGEFRGGKVETFYEKSLESRISGGNVLVGNAADLIIGALRCFLSDSSKLFPEFSVDAVATSALRDAANSSERDKKEAAAFVKKKLDSAKWFVEAIKQRHNTLQSTMQAIIDYQHDYFMDGDESHLKPMVLKDIAERTGFDISTVSRVVNSKYIETHFGIYSLKYFFSEGLENTEGEEVSTRELKKALQECVDAEDKRNPLTDDQLVAELNKRGYKVARRTIAKYRDQLNIPKARMRREL